MMNGTELVVSAQLVIVLLIHQLMSLHMQTFQLQKLSKLPVVVG